MAEIYTQKQLAHTFGVAVSTVRVWHKKGCPHFYIGDKTKGSGARPRYDVQQVRAWLVERTSRKEVQA